MSPDRPQACERTPGQAGIGPLVARVDLGQLVANMQCLRRAAPGLGMLAVVKADAYGHGAVPVARSLVAAGAEGLCVATLAEALELRQHGLQAPILVFGDRRPESVPIAAAQGIDLAVVSADHLRDLLPLVPRHPVRLHLKLDTGMGNSGFQGAELGAAMATLGSLKPWLVGVMGHYTDAEAPDGRAAARQRQTFQAGVAQLREAGIAPPMVHHANSAGCLRGFTEGDTHVRCGIGLYGLLDVPAAAPAGLRPILELSAEVTRAVRVPPGTPVGYGSTWVAPHPVVLATLACGYADGYSRALSNRAWAGFEGGTYPLVGKVSMDVVVAVLPEDAVIRAGDRMTLLSCHPEDPHSVLQTARLLGTIGYEVTCALHRRVIRQYS